MEFNNKTFIDECGFTTLNSNLNCFRTMVVRSNAPPEVFNLTTEAYLENVLINELYQSFVKEILRELYKTQNCDYIDLIGVTEFTAAQKITEVINNHNYKNCITNANIASCFDSVSLFSASKLDMLNHVYFKCGSLGNSLIWVDPFAKWIDTKICLFDDVDMNIINFKKNTDNSLEVDYAFDIKDSKMIYIFFDKNSDSYNKFAAHRRDKQISDILN